MNSEKSCDCGTGSKWHKLNCSITRNAIKAGFIRQTYGQEREG